MTVGKDVSMLFPSVVNCMQTADLELKKLVYLYLINYAKTQPDLAIMAVNTFVKVGQRSRLAGRKPQWTTPPPGVAVVGHLAAVPQVLAGAGIQSAVADCLCCTQLPPAPIAASIYPPPSPTLHKYTPAPCLSPSSYILQDSQDPNPLIRALAVRTMGCIRVDKITEYLCDPLQRCLKVGGVPHIWLLHQRQQQHQQLQ